MAVETATERAIFFDTDDFGLAATYTLNGGASSTVNGIFDNQFLEVDPLGGVGVISAQPQFTCTSADLPGAAAVGDGISISSVGYKVREIQAEGTGVTVLVLEKN